MPYLNGFEASIVVGENKILPSYGVVIDEPQRKLTCWIPPEAGQHYKVVWKCRNSFIMESRGDVFINGIGVGSERIHQSSSIIAEKANSTLGNSESFAFPEQFDISELITDKMLGMSEAMDTSATEAPTVVGQHRGEIRLVIHRVHNLKGAQSLQKGLPEDLDRIIIRIATFVFQYGSSDFPLTNDIENRGTMILSAITDSETMEQDVPSASGSALRQSEIIVPLQNLGRHGKVREIRKLEKKLDNLYAKKVRKENDKHEAIKSGSEVQKRPTNKELRKAAEKQKLEDEIRNLPLRPKSERVRRRQGTLTEAEASPLLELETLDDEVKA